MKRNLWMRVVALPCSLLASAAVHAGEARRGLERIEHIVIIYAENHSFDNLFGLFPGANGIQQATAEQKTQLDHDGKPLPYLPPVYHHGKPDAKYPQGLPNGPFRIDADPVNVRLDQQAPNPVHNYWHSMEQINDGKNNKFVAMTNVGAWVMGYYDSSKLRMWQWAKQYTLADNFFMGAFGGSFLNHQWLICACTPRHADAPAELRPQLDDHGRLKRRPSSPASVLVGPIQVFDGRVTPDGFVVNTSQPSYQPSGIAPAPNSSLEFADAAKFPVPPQTAKTIGDTLSAKGISWVWYGSGWNRALADGRQPPAAKRSVIYNRDPGSPNFQVHHQPFNYFANFAPGTAARAVHLRDGDEFLQAIERGRLPQVAFYKPVGSLSQHPGNSTIERGDQHLADLLERLSKSPQWKKMAVIVTYDENGGHWDHVPPLRGPGWGDRWGPGSRVATIIVSPFAKRGYVDHTSMDTTSILKFITKRFELEPLAGVRANVGDLSSAFDLRWPAAATRNKPAAIAQ